MAERFNHLLSVQCQSTDVNVFGSKVAGRLGSQLIAPQEIAAIEVYPNAASLPAEFRGSTGGCGAIVIWSK